MFLIFQKNQNKENKANFFSYTKSIKCRQQPRFTKPLLSLQNLTRLLLCSLEVNHFQSFGYDPCNRMGNQVVKFN